MAVFVWRTIESFLCACNDQRVTPHVRACVQPVLLRIVYICVPVCSLCYYQLCTFACLCAAWATAYFVHMHACVQPVLLPVVYCVHMLF
jgi:hypothetical protein